MQLLWHPPAEGEKLMGCADCFYDDTPCIGGCAPEDGSAMAAEEMILAVQAAAFDAWIERIEMRA